MSCEIRVERAMNGGPIVCDRFQWFSRDDFTAVSAALRHYLPERDTPYILDVDLDFFSTKNPFKTLHDRVNLYDKLAPLYAFHRPDSTDPEPTATQFADPQCRSIGSTTSHEFPCDRSATSVSFRIAWIVGKEKDPPHRGIFRRPARNIVRRRYANSLGPVKCVPAYGAGWKRVAFPLLYGPADSSFMLLALLVHKITRAGDTDASLSACARTVDASVDLMYAGTPCYLSYPENSTPHCDCNRRLCRHGDLVHGVLVFRVKGLSILSKGINFKESTGASLFDEYAIKIAGVEDFLRSHPSE
ncbi:hypothetical protein WN48_11054 [Eufriesea mexicana]|nr:hypothetical protein WN48_11054 [Eufriesea mexicana]